jgi:hypothetical protein
MHINIFFYVFRALDQHKGTALMMMTKTGSKKEHVGPENKLCITSHHIILFTVELLTEIIHILDYCVCMYSKEALVTSTTLI